MMAFRLQKVATPGMVEKLACAKDPKSGAVYSLAAVTITFGDMVEGGHQTKHN